MRFVIQRVTICWFWIRFCYFLPIEFLITNNNNDKRNFDGNKNIITYCELNYSKSRGFIIFYLKKKEIPISSSNFLVRGKIQIIILPIKCWKKIIIIMRLEKGSSGVYPALVRHTSANHTNRERRFRSTSRMAMQTTDVSPHPSSRYDIQYIFSTPVIWQRYNWIVSSLFISAFFYTYNVEWRTYIYMYIYI